MNTSAHSKPRNGARWLTQALEAEGVETLFGYPGGTIMPFYDALVDSKLKHILVRHEQGAALAANGFARASGRVGVCVATSGPGASNLVTGIADALKPRGMMLAPWLPPASRVTMVGAISGQCTALQAIMKARAIAAAITTPAGKRVGRFSVVMVLSFPERGGRWDRGR